MLAKRPRCGGVFALAIALATLSARAEEPPSRVSVVLAADAAELRELELVLRELLERIEVSVEVTSAGAIDPALVVSPPPSPAPALARVWIDARDARVATLYLADSPWERVLVRRVPLTQGLDEVGREQLAHIVESSVEALKNGAQIGLDRREVRAELGLPPPPVEQPPATSTPRASATPEVDRTREPKAAAPPARRALELRLGLGYQAVLFTSDRVLHGPLGRLDAALDYGSWRFGLALAGQYRVPVRTAIDPIGMRYESVAARGLATARYAADLDTALLFELGGGADIERVEPVAESGGALELSPAETRLRPVLWAGVGIELGVLSLGWLTAIAGVELDPSPDDYVFRQGARTQTVATPLLVRPGVALVIGAPLLGG